MKMYNFKTTFNRKRILITGHTGFKGAWLTTWLKLLGADILGISLDIPTKPSHFLKSKKSLDIKDKLQKTKRNYSKV